MISPGQWQWRNEDQIVLGIPLDWKTCGFFLQTAHKRQQDKVNELWNEAKSKAFYNSTFIWSVSS